MGHMNWVKNPESLRYYLRLSDFAVRKGLKVKEDVKKSARVYQKLEKERRDRKLYNLLKGKKVAVVGNGSYELGKKSGKEIDAHDIVIRMNNYVIEGFEEDYGTRTDVWIRGFGGTDLEDRTLTNDYLYTGITGSFDYLPVLFDYFLDTLYRDCLERDINIGEVEPNMYQEIWQEYGLDPSTGFSVIYTLKKCGIDFEVYGYSFLENKLSRNSDFSVHYFSAPTKDRLLTSPHRVGKEIEILSTWFEGRSLRKD